MAQQQDQAGNWASIPVPGSPARAQAQTRVHKRVSAPINEDPTLDQLLDKISEIGMANLTEKEKELLKNYSN